MINEIIYWELYALVVSFFNGVLLAWISYELNPPFVRL